MSTQILYYVEGNLTNSGSAEERQLEAKDPSQVVVANTANSNKEEDKWMITPEPKDGIVVKFQSKKFGNYLGTVSSQVVCTANLQSSATEFRLTAVGKEGTDIIYNIQPVGGSPDCANKFLTMDDPKGGQKITVVAKMTNDKHKQKWKFQGAPGGSANNR